MNKNVAKPLFVLGVGSQKAGTSWLHKQLDNNKNFNMGFTKEYHIWDAKFLPISSKFDYQNKKKLTLKKTLKKFMQSYDGLYEEYFKSLIYGRFIATGDITPSYSMLGQNELGIIKERLERAGFNIKVIFLMREPVARNWSALRMLQREKKRRGVKILDQDLILKFPSWIKEERQYRRTQYDQTVKNLKNVFDQKSIYFGFYESLFSRDSISNISNFLEVELKDVDFDERINASKEIELPIDMAKECRAHYNHIYEFCFDEFPESQTLWNKKI